MLQPKEERKINDDRGAEREEAHIDEIHPNAGRANSPLLAQPFAHAKSLALEKGLKCRCHDFWIMCLPTLQRTHFFTLQYCVVNSISACEWAADVAVNPNFFH